MKPDSLLKPWQFHAQSKYALSVDRRGLLIVFPVTLMGVIWGLTGDFNVAPASIALYISMFLSVSMLSGFKIEMNTGKYSFRLNLALAALAFLPYERDIRTTFLVWIIATFTIVFWEKHWVSGVSWALTTTTNGVASMVVFYMLEATSLLFPLPVLVSILFGYFVHGLLFATFTSPRGGDLKRESVLRLRLSAVILQLTLAFSFVGFSFIVMNRDTILGLNHSETQFAPAFFLLTLSSTMAIMYDRLRYLRLQSKFLGMIGAALRLPWGMNVSEAKTAMVEHTKNVIPNTWAGFRLSPPKDNELGEPFSRTKGVQEYLIVNRGYLGAPFSEMDESILKGLVHIGEVNIASQAEQQKLLKVAETDPLTGLANYRALRARLEEALNGVQVSALFIDVDDFKMVNDKYGHQAGNEVLVELANRIRHAIRNVDLAARVGGDEFFVFFEGTSSSVANNIRRRVMSLVSKPFVLSDGQVLQVGVSVGLHYTERLEDINLFFDSSDQAMYKHKQDDIVQQHGAELVSSNCRQQVIGLEHTEQVRAGLLANRFYIALQPLVDVETNMFVGAEALVRLDDEAGKHFPTSVILSVASAFDMMNLLSSGVLDLAFEQVSALNQRWNTLTRVHVNLEAMQLMDDELHEKILQKLNEYPALKLTIELTENSLYDTSDELFDRINMLRFEHGVEIAMDDFGKEFSSLRALVHFPVDMVKMDRSFAQALLRREDRSALVIHALVELSEQLKYSILVEGVEHSTQAEQLKQIGVDMAQGFYYGRPTSVSALHDRFNEFGLDVDSQ